MEPTQLVVSFLLLAVGVYSIVGIAVAGWLLSGRLAALDAGMAEAGWAARLILVPGIVALWPLVLQRWTTRTTSPTGPLDSPGRMEGVRRRHPILVVAVTAVVGPAVFVALAGRLTPPVHSGELPSLKAAANGPIRIAHASGSAELRLQPAAAGQPARIEVEASDLEQPLALYWIPNQPTRQVAAAQFIGVVANSTPTSFPLVEGDLSRQGRFQLLAVVPNAEARP